MNAQTARLAGIPQVQKLLESEPVRKLCDQYRREDAIAVLRGELKSAREDILAGKAIEFDFYSPAFFERLRGRLQERSERRLRRVINATGVVLHTNLGRAPLAPQALDAIREIAAGYANLEFDLESGERGTRYAHVEERLCRLTGAEAALVVNNCAAAVMLCLMAHAAGGEVVVSRGELIEIGGAFRMPDVIAQSGARLVEVGATNKTRLSDYEMAIGEHTRMLLKSHPSNYRIVGFTAFPERQELAQLAKRHGLLLVEDLGSGTLADLRRYGLPHEPTVQECVAAGVDLLTFSGDKLLGGPQAGIIVGRREAVAVLKKHPLLRALRIDKLSLAALEATLQLYELPSPPEQHIPVLRMLAENQATLRRRARSLAARLRTLPHVECRVEDDVSYAGGGSLPETAMPTSVLSLAVRGMTPDALAQCLRRHHPALIGRIRDGSFVIDLRTVAPDEIAETARIVREAFA